MKYARLVMVSVIVFSIGSAVFADWNPGDDYKMHFPQLPDLSIGPQPTGMNVLATWPKVLADDFRCTQSGPITGIHIWGSWLFDEFPVDSFGTGNQDPGFVGFHLSIHDDIPAGTGGLEHSRPGDMIWEWDFLPGEFTWRNYADANEFFFDPNAQAVIGIDTQVIQYNFDLSNTVIPVPPPVQEVGKIYWLDVMALPLDTEPDIMFGWKTSRDHWNDDAVYGDVDLAGGVPPDWFELRYPFGHPFEFESIDLAFVITPEPATISLLCIGGLALLRRRRR